MDVSAAPKDVQAAPAPGLQGRMGSLLAFARSRHFLISVAVHLVAFAFMMGFRLDLQWFWLLLFSAVSVPFAPYINDPVKFFRGGLTDHSSSTSSWALLSVSTFVSWVFAKSIQNASTLGASYGIMGGAAYAAYYTSFPSVAVVVYFLRTRHGYRSLPEAVYARYGEAAALSFALAVLYRLFQEVWSNSVVVASFYGPVHSGSWWAAAIVSTAVPAFYCVTGGMRASLLTDFYQGALKCVFLVVVLIVLGTRAVESFGSFNWAGTCALPAGVSPTNATQCSVVAGNPVNATGGLVDPIKSTTTFAQAACNYTGIPSQELCTAATGLWSAAKCTVKTQPSCADAAGSWAPRPVISLANGVDLLIVGLMQGLLSYPFFDPVLTDRAFLAKPKTMVLSFLTGGALSATFILLFSFVGIYGRMVAVLEPDTVPSDIYAGVYGGMPASVAKYFGTAVYSIVNLVFLISSCAVLDSTFSSTSKLFGPEFTGVVESGRPKPPQLATHKHAWAGRIAIVVMAIVGTLPLIANPSTLDATTVSGTVVIGLGPPIYFLIFIKGYRPLVFHLSFWTGVAFAVVYQIGISSSCNGCMNLNSFYMGGGPYALLLGFNVISTVACWGLACIALLDNWKGKTLVGREELDNERDAYWEEDRRAFAEGRELRGVEDVKGAV